MFDNESFCYGFSPVKKIIRDFSEAEQTMIRFFSEFPIIRKKNELEKIDNFFQAKIHFHPRHEQPNIIKLFSVHQ